MFLFHSSIQLTFFFYAQPIIFSLPFLIMYATGVQAVPAWRFPLSCTMLRFAFLRFSYARTDWDGSATCPFLCPTCAKSVSTPHKKAVPAVASLMSAAFGDGNGTRHLNILTLLSISDSSKVIYLCIMLNIRLVLSSVRQEGK